MESRFPLIRSTARIRSYRIGILSARAVRLTQIREFGEKVLFNAK